MTICKSKDHQNFISYQPHILYHNPGISDLVVTENSVILTLPKNITDDVIVSYGLQGLSVLHSFVASRTNKIFIENLMPETKYFLIFKGKCKYKIKKHQYVKLLIYTR